MAEDIIFRSAPFGGFNKEDVLAYINDIKAESDACARRCAQLENEIKDAQEAKITAQKLLEEKSEELESAAALKDAVCAELDEKNEQLKAIAASLASAQNELAETKAENAAADSGALDEKDRLIAELELAIRAVKAENAAFADENRQLKENTVKPDEEEYAQTAVGNAIIDARRFADTIIGETEDKIDDISSRARNAVDAAQSKIRELNESIGRFAAEIAAVIESANADTAALDNDIKAFAEFFTTIKQEIGGYVSPLDKE